MDRLVKVHPPQESDNNLIVFTDGACSNNGKAYARASYAVVWPYHEQYNQAHLLSNPTNNRAEYMALLLALQICEEQIDPTFTKTLIAYTDSMLLFNSVTEWMSKWKRNGWITSTKEPVANRDLLEAIDAAMDKRKVIMRHVRAHQKVSTWEATYNNFVDRLARNKLKN